MAVHEAVIAGHKDIARIILEAGNMTDINTATFYSKETLAHLAVKHGHQSLYQLLHSFQADFSAKDSNGKYVFEVTDDQVWKSDIISAIVEHKKAMAKGKCAKPGNTILEHEGPSRAEHFRSLVSSQRDKEHQLTVAISNADWAKKSGKLMKKNAVLSSPPMNDDSAKRQASELMKDLDVSSSAEVHANSKNDNSRYELRDLFYNAVTSFTRLRDPNIPADAKYDDARRAIILIVKLEKLTEYMSHPSWLNTTDLTLRKFVASKALEVIFLMQKLHRSDYPAVSAPIVALVKKECETTRKLLKTVVGTAKLLILLDKKSQAREIMALAEKRLVKMPFNKRTLSGFRDLFQMYTGDRDAMGFGMTESIDTFVPSSGTCSTALGIPNCK
ncbi:unnamed protein product [Phytophthora lilii]|uniref:Unnamed protein product n=1 Tax=Phytophthora lilii TaxID=2077276 RepID=A0A9W6WQV5_9STRA|nr:unnamed protein product [Phytophthora lilii]